jgi:hypothetical protein
MYAEAKRVFEEKGMDDINMVRVFPGLLTELSVGPWFGMDCREGRIGVVGDAEQRCSYTSKGDVGKAVAVLASMIPNDVPEKVRVSGDSLSMKDVVNEMGELAAVKLRWIAWMLRSSGGRDWYKRM